MVITRNIHWSASCVLELFKFITSLSLVSAVSVWLGVIGGYSTGISIPPVEDTLVLASFVFLLIRYYHGNSLHLLETYAEDTPTTRPNLSLPADAFFIILQGLLLVALSLTVKAADVFVFILLALLVFDVMWAGLLIIVHTGGSGGYLRAWLIINIFCFFLLLIAAIALRSEAGLEHFVPHGIFAVVTLQTLLDYSITWKKYFPSAEPMSLMIGAPFTVKVVDGEWSDEELCECIMRAEYLCRQDGYSVYSSHIIEQFGASIRSASDYVKEDIAMAKRAAIYIGITDGSISNGMAVEIAVAAAYKTRIILFVRRESPHVAFLEEVVRTSPEGTIIEYHNADDLVEKLRSELHLKGRDLKAAGLFRPPLPMHSA